MCEGFSRRDFLKTGATTGLVAGGLGALQPLEAGAAPIPGVTWEKSVCRFCGTGCGVMVGTRNGKIVGVQGDEQSPTNKGLLCIKGYSLPGIVSGQDRLTSPLIRKNGKLVKASWNEALDLVAKKFSETLKAHGPEAISMYGSGQWMITDGYVASKWFRAGLGSNQVEANARLCMASAVTGFLTTFGSDEPMGCYDDLDLCDGLVLWGNNMAEMHPMLWTRVLENKRKNPKMQIIELATRRTRTTDSVDQYLEFRPQTDLAIANGICHVLIQKGLVDKAFIEKHVVFKKGKTNIGYGLEDKFKFADDPKPSSLEELTAFLADYTPEKVAEISGVPAEAIVKLAGLFGDPKLKVTSVWCMGMNQHTRGTWMNNLVYNIHLLTGQICKPGATPLSLTGQPAACGTVREVGTLCHRLPADMLVANPEHRAIAAKIWKVPVEKLNAKPGLNTVEMFRAYDRGEIKCLWIQTTNPFSSMPNLNRYRKAAKKDGRFLVVSDVYPTETTQYADVVLPAAMWVEREGMFGNTERRTQQWNKLAEPPKGCMPDDWQMIEVARRMGLGHLFPTNPKTYVKELYEEYRQFTLGTGHDLASYEDLKTHRGMRWPVVNGKETARRYVEGEDPYVKPGEGIKFYKNKATGGKAVVWLRPYEPAAEVPDKDYPLWLCTGRVIEHWHTGTMTRRVPQLNRAVPKAYVEVHPDDAKALGIQDGEKVRLRSRRGVLELEAHLDGRGKSQKGNLFVPLFDESLLANLLTLDAYCPISAQPDYKKCAVRMERV